MSDYEQWICWGWIVDRFAVGGTPDRLPRVGALYRESRLPTALRRFLF